MSSPGCSSLEGNALCRRPPRLSDARRDPEWILQALQATGTATVRSCRLPAEQVVWRVLGLALFRNQSIQDLVNKLVLALPGGSLTVALSSVVEARARLGAEPIAWLFGIPRTTGRMRAHAATAGVGSRGTASPGRYCASQTRRPNVSHFGYSHSVRGESADPLVRVVARMTLRSHLLAAVTFGPYETGEISYAADLWSSIPRDSLPIIDRGFFSARILTALARDRDNRPWLIRATKNLRWRTCSGSLSGTQASTELSQIRELETHKMRDHKSRQPDRGPGALSSAT